MKQFDNITTVYFLGIGGIGMSALARYFKHMECRVAGYDRTRTDLTRELEEEGIDIHYTDTGTEVAIYLGQPENTLVVWTPALPADHKELNWIRAHGYELWKRSRVLGFICENYPTLAVAGTHGKTTVSTMVTSILQTTPARCGAILGGVSRNFGTNLLLPDNHQQWMVTEADEYDRSFLQLSPDIAIITAMDADHLDIYGAVDTMQEAFVAFAQKTRNQGKILVHRRVAAKLQGKLPEGVALLTYALEPGSDFFASGLTLDESSRCYRFRLCTPEGMTPEIEMTYPGIVNVENGVAAGAAAWLAGAAPNEIQAGLEGYLGVRRRFDLRFKGTRTIYIDDYAHHPEELRAFINSVRLLYPGRRITGIFQPHLFTRTRDFIDEFARSLELCDQIALLPIYPARELPIPGITSELLLSKIQSAHKQMLEKSAILDYITHHQPEVLLTMGAGDIDVFVQPITTLLANAEKN